MGDLRSQYRASDATGEKVLCIEGSGFRTGGFALIHVNGKAYTPETILAALEMYERSQKPRPTKRAPHDH